MTEAELKDHLDAAEKSPKQIAAAVLGLPEKTLRYKPSPDKWCILEILGHLADMEILYAYRIRQMLALLPQTWLCNGRPGRSRRVRVSGQIRLASRLWKGTLRHSPSPSARAM
jgi:hypothetical protein